MLLSELKLNNFRNHRQLDLQLPISGKPIYISGPNGAGKTSVVEAIYLLLTLKTFKQQQLKDIKSFDQNYFRIEGIFSNSAETEKAVYFYDETKTLLINNEQSGMSSADYTNQLPVICYSPNFETMLSGENSYRRQAIDRALFYLDKQHMADVRLYNMLLKRKRAELEAPHSSDLVAAINDQIIPLSKKISDARLAFVNELSLSLKNDRISAELMRDNFDVKLTVSPIGEEETKKELATLKVTRGCHRDTFSIMQDGRIIDKFQSFGQKKTCLLLLLYHMAIRIEKSRNCDIIVLLDDFEAGLDDKRCLLINDLMTGDKDADKADKKNQRQIVLTGIENRYCGDVEKTALS